LTIPKEGTKDETNRRRKVNRKRISENQAKACVSSPETADFCPTLPMVYVVA
jgi:hypothetical protein